MFPYFFAPFRKRRAVVESVGATINFVPRSSRRAPGRLFLGYRKVMSLRVDEGVKDRDFFSLLLEREM